MSLSRKIRRREKDIYPGGCLFVSEVIVLLVSPYAKKRGLGAVDIPTHDEYMEMQYDHLAAEMRKYIDIERIYDIMSK